MRPFCTTARDLFARVSPLIDDQKNVFDHIVRWEVFDALRAPRQANATSLGGSASVGDLHSTAFRVRFKLVGALGKWADNYLLYQTNTSFNLCCNCNLITPITDLKTQYLGKNSETSHQTHHHQSHKMPVTRKEFEDVFPQLVDDLVANCKQSNLPEQALKWYKQV